MDLQTEDSAYHYGVIARAISRLDAAGGAAVPLETLAAELRMSPAHFQRVFSRWVGVSPKRYQQYLALDHARHLLAQRFTVLQAADAAGLSGGGRLHDLFLRWEAMSPGEFARGGDGLTVRHGWIDSPFGEALVMATDRGICGIGFADGADWFDGAEDGSGGHAARRAAVMDDLSARWPKARLVADAAAVRPLAKAAFGAGKPGAEVPVHAIGAPFQIKVWEALLRIPSGQVTTYAEIAGAIGNPRAVRAVGTAVGRNPVSWLIPCHRALRKSGGLGGYHWGLPVKRAMLAWEAARADARAS